MDQTFCHLVKCLALSEKHSSIQGRTLLNWDETPRLADLPFSAPTEFCAFCGISSSIHLYILAPRQSKLSDFFLSVPLSSIQVSFLSETKCISTKKQPGAQLKPLVWVSQVISWYMKTTLPWPACRSLSSNLLIFGTKHIPRSDDTEKAR